MNIKVKEIVKYNGHKVKANGAIDLSFKAMYSELTNSMQVLQFLNNDVKLKVKIGTNKPMELGMFRVQKVIVDNDGESILNFTSLTDFIDLDNINNLIGKDEFHVMFEANVELEEEEEE